MNSIFEYINNLADDNQMIAGAISLWFMGVITYIFKSVPVRIFEFIKKHITTEFVTTNQHKIFHDLLRWFEKNNYSEKFRNIKLSNGQWGGDEAVKSVGYGKHLIWHRYSPIWVELEKHDSRDIYDKETIKLIKIGRSHKVFNSLFKELKEADDFSKTKLYKQSKDGWRFVGSQPKRTFDSIIMNSKNYENLIKTVDDFLNNEDWYIKNGIPYSLGIMLYGPPGTGKTSIIKALAAYTDRNIYITSPFSLAYIENCSHTDEKNITVIEDIDSFKNTNKRKEKDEEDFSSFCNISDVLNAIDGVITNHGRILIMTTNHINKLDPALLRPGRCDLKLEISYFNDDMFRAFMDKFFPDRIVNINIKENVTGAELQESIISRLSFEEIIDKFSKKIKSTTQG